MEAWIRWTPHVRPQLSQKIDNARRRALKFLQKSQCADGAWIPLWFGNESARDHEKPVYGTARTLIALNEMNFDLHDMRSRAATFLQQTQLDTSGWGGDANTPESLEETAVAVEATADPRGVRRLLELIETDQMMSAPIGLYFARLWYYEKVYPLIFATGALGSILSKKL